MPIGGGEHPPDTTLGDYQIDPIPIQDSLLRELCDRVIRAYQETIA
jgi:hypothetical protein